MLACLLFLFFFFRYLCHHATAALLLKGVSLRVPVCSNFIGLADSSSMRWRRAAVRGCASDTSSDTYLTPYQTPADDIPQVTL